MRVEFVIFGLNTRHNDACNYNAKLIIVFTLNIEFLLTDCFFFEKCTAATCALKLYIIYNNSSSQGLISN